MFCSHHFAQLQQSLLARLPFIVRAARLQHANGLAPGPHSLHLGLSADTNGTS